MNNKGETLVETLVALMIIVLVITGFAEVINKVAKVNATIKQNRVYYKYDSTNTPKLVIKIKDYTTNKTTTYDYKSYLNIHESNGLYFYEAK